MDCVNLASDVQTPWHRHRLYLYSPEDQCILDDFLKILFARGHHRCELVTSVACVAIVM